MDERRSEIGQLRNLGPKSEQWLNSIGIYTRAELAELGAVDAYHILKGHGYNVSLNLVYAIQATLLDVHWTALPAEVKAALRAEIAGA